MRKLSKVLKSILPYNKADKWGDSFLCFSAEDAWRAGAVTGGECSVAKTHFSSQLGYWGCAEAYLECQCNVPSELLTPKNMVAYRKRWLKHMIKQLQKEGN